MWTWKLWTPRRSPARWSASETRHRNAGWHFSVKVDGCLPTSERTWSCCGRCQSAASCKCMGKEQQKLVTKPHRSTSELWPGVPQNPEWCMQIVLWHRKAQKMCWLYGGLTCWLSLLQSQRHSWHTELDSVASCCNYSANVWHAECDCTWKVGAAVKKRWDSEVRWLEVGSKQAI